MAWACMWGKNGDSLLFVFCLLSLMVWFSSSQLRKENSFKNILVLNILKKCLPQWDGCSVVSVTRNGLALNELKSL